MKTIEISVAGRVQGIGFRACVKRIATNLGVVGEVMNLPDGRVRIIATAEPGILDKFVSMLYSCPHVIIREIVQREFPLINFSEFSIQRSGYYL